MRIWLRNHAGGNISARVIEVTDALYHAEATGLHERTATLDDRVRHTLALAQQRADEMARSPFGHRCEPILCDEWHIVADGGAHGQRFPLKQTDPVAGGPPASLLIIRRGRTAWADYLVRRLGDLTERVDFVWDRRFGERRRFSAPVPDDRRSSDRRGSDAVVWSDLNFMLVYSPDPPR